MEVPCVHGGGPVGGWMAGGWPVGPAAGKCLESAVVGSLRASGAVPPVANGIVCIKHFTPYQ